MTYVLEFIIQEHFKMIPKMNSIKNICITVKRVKSLLNQARIDRMAGFWLKAGQGDHGSTGG